MSDHTGNDPVVEDIAVEADLDHFVNTPEFDRLCTQKAREHVLSDESDGSDHESFWSSDDSVSSANTVDSGPYEVSRLEANLYYAGIGTKGRGPKLIYRTSDDVFEEPTGPEAYKRLMRAVSVPESHELGQEGLWDRIRDQVVVLLKQRNIKVTSVDFLRFTWLNKKKDQEIEDEDEDEDGDGDEEDFSYDDIPRIQPVEDGDRYYTNPTIWIGVVPETLSAAVAHESATEIRAVLKSLQVQRVDIAYRESICKSLAGHGPALFAPVEDGHPLKDVIDNVSVPLSLPIAGRKTTMQGTLGPYFHVGDKLFAITGRHNLFPADGDNELYRYHGTLLPQSRMSKSHSDFGPPTESAPKKKVLVMGAPAFTNYLASIQALIGANIDSVESLEQKNATLRHRVEGGINVEESQAKLAENKAELAKLHTKIDTLKRFFVEIKKRWSKAKDRVIGFVSWAPPIGTAVAPHRYTRDVCVVELYKDKFKNLLGNVLSLGPEMSPSKLKGLMYDRVDLPSEFKYPEDGLLVLKGMLTAEEINNPNSLSLQGDLIRRVIKRGSTTNTTVGTLTCFMSYVRKYFPTGDIESLEVPILSHEHDNGTFSKGGDSGSLIVSALGQFVALLTGGTNKGTDGSDITFATPFEYVWELVKDEYPGANLYFDDTEAFFANVV
ncbi:hypothetical protein HDZ31DRAFT_71061 [Schizophyllum fasciatum]